MKVYDKPVEVVAHYKIDGSPRPLRFTIKEDKNKFEVRGIVTQRIEEMRIKGKRILKFVCQSVINNRLKVFELRFSVENCKWTLFKI